MPGRQKERARPTISRVRAAEQDRGGWSGAPLSQQSGNCHPPVPQRAEALHSRTRHVGGSRGVARRRRALAQGPSLTREASTDTAGPVGRPLAICPLESLVSAQDGAADRVGKKGFAEKGLFYCNYLESESQGGGGRGLHY